MFTPVDELQGRYAPERVDHLLRIRDMYNWFLNNPSGRDRAFVAQFAAKYKVAESKIYADLALVKQLMPMLTPASREFWRTRVSDMLLETYNMAKSRKDTKAMAMAAKELGKVNRVEMDDEKEFPFDLIVLQPFTPSSDPTLVGVKPIPNVEEVRARLKKTLIADIPDIEDVEYEAADLEEETLFPSETSEAS
jgi:hypothetical protein